jgi:hypothetical protein
MLRRARAADSQFEIIEPQGFVGCFRRVRCIMTQKRLG